MAEETQNTPVENVNEILNTDANLAGNTIILARSGVTGSVPTPSIMEHGELFVNYADGKIFYKNAGNTVGAFLDATNIGTYIKSMIAPESGIRALFPQETQPSE